MLHSTNFPVQDELKLKDYDIEHEAKGVDKAVKRKINAVVNDKTLQIRFVYTGKGTNAVPTRGIYGPLISAISIESGKIYSLLKILFIFMIYFLSLNIWKHINRFDVLQVKRLILLLNILPVVFECQRTEFVHHNIPFP